VRALIYRELSSSEVFLVHGGARFLVPAAALADFGGPTAVRVVVDGGLEQFPTMPRDGTVLRELSRETVYVVFGGARFKVPDADTLARLYGGDEAVRVVPDRALARAGIGLTPREGTLLREESSGAVFVMRGGRKAWLPDPRDVADRGGDEAVRVVPDRSLSRFLARPPLPPAEPRSRRAGWRGWSLLRLRRRRDREPAVVDKR
jgi:hypothetical protein